MALFILWFSGFAVAGQFTGHMIGVSDGDTILHNQQPECTLLSGIDCPEKGTDNLRADCSRPEV